MKVRLESKSFSKCGFLNEVIFTVEALSQVDSSTYGRLNKTPFFSTPVQTLYFFIPVSGQLQLRIPFKRPEGVPRSRELPLYLRTNYNHRARDEGRPVVQSKEQAARQPMKSFTHYFLSYAN